MIQTTPIWFSGLALASALIALSLGAVCLAHKRAGAFNRFYRSLAMVLGASGVMQIGNGLGLLDPSHALVWRRMALLGELAQPAALAYVGRALMESTTTGGNDAVALWRARAITFLAVVFGILNGSDLLFASRADDQMEWVVMGPLGRPCYVFLLLSLALGLAQLEQILRALHDPARYQLKFVLIGLGALAGYEIYQASQLLLMPVWRPEHVLIGGLALLVAVGLIAYGLGRCRLQEIRSKVYVSQQVLYGSLTFIVIGVYLVGVGLIGEVVRYGGNTLGLVLSTGIVFLATVGLVVALFSRTVRAELQRFIARHFFRSKYDYRAKWLEVTEAFHACVLVEAILDRLIALMSRTFGAGRISVWMRYETDGCFHQVRSINVETAPPLDAGHPVLKRLLATDEPLALEGPPDAAGASDPFLEATRAVLCVPLQSIDGLIAFVTLSRERHEDRYGTDDCDLLRAIAHHAAVLLSQARLSEERRAAAEMEALHRFSAFYVHDLKNLAAGLSLVVKNAEVHGKNPEFQQSAMRTIAMSVRKMMALTGKLSPQSVSSGQPEPVDVHQAIAETIGSLNGGLRTPVRQEGEHVPPILIRRDQFQQVLLNVILNAQHALGGQGEIVIATERTSRSVGITIADTGCGIGPERLRTLFQPFQTTKQGGLGIGLYQCKRIVESHGGSISINSRAGEGTRVHIQLPTAEAAAAPTPRADRVAM